MLSSVVQGMQHKISGGRKRTGSQAVCDRVSVSFLEKVHE